MIADIVIGGAIFGLALWLVARSIRLSRRGICAGCAMRERCGSCGCAPAADQGETVDASPQR